MGNPSGEPTTIWDLPPGTKESVGWRHFVALAITIAGGTLVSGLGTVSFPLGDTPGGFAPAAAVQVVAGIWFGGWGVLAGVIFPAVVRAVTGPDNLLGRVLADLIMSGLPAWWFRYSRRDPRLQFRRDRLMFLVVVVGATNLLAATVGATQLALVGEWSAGRWMAQIAAWFASGAGPCLVLGLPLLRTLSPVVTRSSVFCRGWWKSATSLGPSMRRFRHQPIIIKIMLGLSAAGFLPLFFVVAVNLWDDYRQARIQAMAKQRELADQIESGLQQVVSSHEELVALYASKLSSVANAESLSERGTVFSPLLPTMFAEVRYTQLAKLVESQDIDRDQTKTLVSGKTLLEVGPGAPPERRRAVNLMRLVKEGDAKGTVVTDSIGLEELENSVFGVARQRHHEYDLTAADGRRILTSSKYRRPVAAADEGDFMESANGATFLYDRRMIESLGWQLELMIPQVYGVKEALAERGKYTAVVTSLALFAALMIGGYLARALEQPIRELTRTMRQAGRLDVEVEAAVHGHDEIGELAATFNEMSRQLRRSIAALERTTAEKERLAYEFELAAELQRRILPIEAPRVAGFEIAGLCVPAREVGGDFYDWQMLSDIRLGFLIGDACGKGLGAAFLINEARSIALAHLQDTPSAGAVLRRTNYTMLQARSTNDLFTTMFCAILSVPTRRLDYASAGHPAPIWYRSSTGEMAGLDTDGRPLGLEPDNPIDQGEANLMIGDVIVAFTDGVLDATNPAGEPFGRQRLEQLVRDHNHLPAAELARRIQQVVLEYCDTSAQFDDLTLLVIRSVDREEAEEAHS